MLAFSYLAYDLLMIHIFATGCICDCLCSKDQVGPVPRSTESAW